MVPVDLHVWLSMTMSRLQLNLANDYNMKSISTSEVIGFSHPQSNSGIRCYGNILGEAFHKHLTLQELLIKAEVRDLSLILKQ